MTGRKRLLITGACGFSGRHLAARLRADGPCVLLGTDLPTEPGTGNLDEYFSCDLTQPQAVADVVARARPDVVYHLAGRIGAAPAEEMHRVNVGGFLALVEALREFAQTVGRQVRVVTVGSAAELGAAGARQLPVLEEALCAPESPYGRSKWEVTRLALAEPPQSPLRMAVARPFNLVGPGLSAELSLGHFARQISAAARGALEGVRCGRLDTRRDYVDVRDAVDAYALLADRAPPGVYNVCAGRSYLLEDLLRTMIDLTGCAIPILSDPSRSHPGDLLDIYGDRAKISREVGWEPTIPMRQSLTDLLASVAPG